MDETTEFGLERKFCRPDVALSVEDGRMIEGYASVFGTVDQGGDVVEPGAYQASLDRLASSGRRVKMLWQHDPTQPIGVWDEVREDGRGLYVKGQLLPGVEKAREAAELLAAGAIDGLSIGYRTVRATKDEKGQRHLAELELWEVSLVTFPMLADARVAGRVAAKQAEEESAAVLRDLAGAIDDARTEFAAL